MLGYTHAMFGMATAAIAVGHDTETLILAGVGALLPDIDHPDSILGRIAPAPVRALCGIASLTYGIYSLGLPFLAGGLLLLISAFLPHRSITHSMLALFLVGGFLPVPLALGYASHLVTDLISGGIPLLWPWNRRLGFPVFKSGRIGDALFLVSSAALLFIIVIMPQVAWV